MDVFLRRNRYAKIRPSRLTTDQKSPDPKNKSAQMKNRIVKGQRDEHYRQGSFGEVFWVKYLGHFHNVVTIKTSRETVN
jgi:hypothetical protein